MKKHGILLMIYTLLSAVATVQSQTTLHLPNQEQLSSGKVNHVMQDSEGGLWYATEGGGLCRDNGRQVDIFRSDAETPDLLGSNKVACLAEAGHLIIVGSYHGAYVLDKGDFTIRRLSEVDDKRVDDILVLRSGDVLLTANQKIFCFSPDMRLKQTYASPGKYVAHLFEDATGRLWATQWSGGLLRLKGSAFEAAPWPLDVSPTDMADAGDGRLWIGTVGRGIVGYDPDGGTIEEQPDMSRTVCIDLQPTADGRQLWVSTTGGLQLYAANGQLQPLPTDGMPVSPGRLSLDRQGCLLVASSQGEPVAVGSMVNWPPLAPLSVVTADSLRQARGLSARPTAYALADAFWYSTGQDIRRQQQPKGQEEVVLPAKDVSAMAFAPDGTLWLGTIFGVVYTYRDGKLLTDDYASNEYGDAIVAMSADTVGRLMIAYDRYARRYDPARQTLRQQSVEGDGIYRIVLAETHHGERWSMPDHGQVVERLPWWVWWVLAVLGVGLLVLAGYVWLLYRQRKHFLAAMKQSTFVKQAPAEEEHPAQKPESTSPVVNSEWLNKAITLVGEHLADDGYSVEQLSSDLCMSRMTLYRKIQQSTGQKPTEFMRTIRLRRAAELLAEGQMTVTEVSYATGFSSVSYFSRCFRTMYGVPPTQFITQGRPSQP